MIPQDGQPTETPADAPPVIPQPKFARPEVFSQGSDYRNRVDLVFELVSLEGGRRVAQPLFYGPDIGDDVIEAPTVTLDRKQAQALADQLADLGFMPSKAKRELGILRDIVTNAKATLDALTKHLT